MSKHSGNRVRVQGTAPRVESEEQSFTQRRRLASLFAAGLLGLALMPGATAAQPREIDDPDHGSNPPVSEVRVDDSGMREGDAGAHDLKFMVRVSPPSASPISVSYRIDDCTASCANADYQAGGGLLTIPANATQGEIVVRVYGDGTLEADETFTLVLTDATHAEIVRGVATGTIFNDDPGGGGDRRREPEMGQPSLIDDPVAAPSPRPASSLVISDNGMAEGNGPSVLTFRINVFPPSDGPITIGYLLRDNTARCEDDDYLASSGVVTIPAGASYGEIPVTIEGDERWEPNETFSVTLTHATSAVIVKETATGTIYNDDFGGGGGPRRMPDGISFELAGANPVHGRLGFRFALPRASRVSLAIFDLAGRMVGTPIEGVFEAGTHVQTWSQSKPAPGIYLARFRADGHTVTKTISWLD